MTIVNGKAWKFGDSIDTDIIIPARYLILPLDEMKEKTMEPVRSDFASEFVKGGIIVAGKNFGCGSSREQAPAVLKALGVIAIVADSFARIFFRNAVNLGIPVVECPGILQMFNEGDDIEVDLSSGKICHLNNGSEFSGSRLPDFLLEIIEDGGLVQHIIKEREKA